METGKRRLITILVGFALLLGILSPILGLRVVALDIPTVDFSQATYNVNEDSGTATIYVHLSAPSGETVTVDYATSNGSAVAGSDYSATNGTLTFIPLETTGMFIVNITNDIRDEDNETVILTLSNASGADLGTTNNPATLTILDNDPPPTVDFGNGTYFFSESVGSAAVTINLSAPSGRTITVDYATSDGTATAGSDYTAASGTLTFIPDDTSEPFGVNLVDDPRDEENETVILTLSGADNATLGSTNNPATLTILDNDSAGFIVDPTSLTVSEPHESKDFTIKLTSEPKADVTVGLSILSDECSVTPQSVTLTIGNWSSGVQLTVTAEDDDVKDGPQPCTVETLPAESTDPKYKSKNPADVDVTVQDDDDAGVGLSPRTVDVSEDGDTDTYQIVLRSEPTAAVTIYALPDGQTTVSPTELVFDPGNWDVGQTVTVSAVDDSVAEGPHQGTISHSASSTDPNYNKPAGAVTADILDNDTAAIIVDPTNLTVSEPSGSETFTITLATKPLASVTIPLSTIGDECSASPGSVLLNSSNWNQGEGVTVTAVDDDIYDGDQICTVETGTAISADPVYKDREADDVTVTVQDDDNFWWAYLPQVARRWPPPPDTPDLEPISNPDGDGSYTVNWDAVSEADTYILQEAKNSTFSGAAPVYDGPDTSYNVTSRGAARYYYRVKAHNSIGDSDWSGSQLVDVLWELEPNGRADQANGPIASNLTYFGTFPGEYDVNDYYYFDLSTARRAELWLHNIPTGHNYDLVLRDSHLNIVGYSGQLGSADEYILTGTLPSGRYSIQVFHRSSGGSAQPYHLQAAYE